MKKILLSALCLSFAFAPVAQAQANNDPWLELSKEVHVHSEYLFQGKKSNAKVWVRLNVDKAGEEIRQIVFLAEINCFDETFRTLTRTSYDKDGKTLSSFNPDRNEVEYIIPSSNFYIVKEGVCHTLSEFGKKYNLE